jgi:hypothetical protein
MSSITLAQIPEKPSTVAIDEAINSFADKRQGRPDISTNLVVPLVRNGSHHSGMRQKHCRGLKWRQRFLKQLTMG